MYTLLKYKKNVLAGCLGLVCVIPQSYGIWASPAPSQKVVALQNCRTTIPKITLTQVKHHHPLSKLPSVNHTITRNLFHLKSLAHDAEEPNGVDVPKSSDLSTLNAFLLGALQAGDEIRLKGLLDAGADIEVRDYRGLTPLMRAACQGQYSIVTILLNYGADANACDDKHQLTPLHLAACLGHVETVQVLLEQGADANARDENKTTPLILAAEQRHEKIIELLLLHGADANAANNLLGCHALHWAASNGDMNIMNLLYAYGADVNAADKNGVQSLHYAAFNNQKEAVQFLLRHGAQVDATDQCGRTPLDCAQYQECTGIMQILENAAG